MLFLFIATYKKKNGLSGIFSCNTEFMEFSRPEYWSGQRFPLGDLPNPGIESRSPALQVDYLSADPQGKPFLVTQTMISLAHCSLMERYSSFKPFCSYGTLDIWDVFGIFLAQKLACKTNFHEFTLFFLPSLFSFLLPFLPLCLPSFLQSSPCYSLPSCPQTIPNQALF